MNFISNEKERLQSPDGPDCEAVLFFCLSGYRQFLQGISRHHRGEMFLEISLRGGRAADPLAVLGENIADLIEAYILRQLAAKQDGKVELRRTDIADEISCAPSQISYVLSTRFTPAAFAGVISMRAVEYSGKRPPGT